MVSAAVPFLHAARLGDAALTELIAQWHRQLKISCFVTGSPDIQALKVAPLLKAPR
jgi:isopentenyl diphosphate isomerase/L-lactate dehydrogenase-like FMN-dependent dehydrogenase